MSDRPLRIVVADDHDLFRKSVTMLLDRDERIDVVGTASDGREAIDVAMAVEPDLVLVDVVMPGMGGIEATRRLRALVPELRVVVMSGIPDAKLEGEAREAGAAAVVGKETFASDLKAVIRQLTMLATGRANATQGRPPKPAI